MTTLAPDGAAAVDEWNREDEEDLIDRTIIIHLCNARVVVAAVIIVTILVRRIGTDLLGILVLLVLVILRSNNGT
jgi:hypothetical protein